MDLYEINTEEDLVEDAVIVIWLEKRENHNKYEYEGNRIFLSPMKIATPFGKFGDDTFFFFYGPLSLRYSKNIYPGLPLFFWGGRGREMAV